MAFPVDPRALAELPETEIVAVRAAFARAGFDERQMSACEAIAPRQLDAVRLPAVLHELSTRSDDASLLTAAFVYGGAVDGDALARALGTEAYGAMDRVGVFAPQDGRIRVRLRITPYRGVWIASDDLHERDPVMGPGRTTDELAHCLEFRGVSSLLDVGCGAGSLALIARASGVAEVVGTDIDPRAIAYAHFNGRLNRLECTWLVGDLAAPVQGRRFGAVVSQPAYVAQPMALEGVTFLHGGVRGDELALRLLGQLDGLLEPRGKGWVLFDSPEVRVRELTTAVQQSLGTGRLDTCLIVTPGHSAADQAIGYASLRDRSLGPVYATTYGAYRRHFAGLGVDRVRHALVYVRGSAGRSVGIALEPSGLAGFTGNQLDEMLDGVAWAGAPVLELLAANVRPSAVARLVHEQSLSAAGDSRLWVRFERGAGVDQELSDTAALLVTCLRDHQPLEAAVAAYALEMEVAAKDATTQAVTFVRQGLRSGLLVVDPSSPAP